MLLYGAIDDSNIIMMGKVANQMQNLYISFTFYWYSYLNMYNCNVIGVLLKNAYFETTATNYMELTHINGPRDYTQRLTSQ